MHLFFPSKYLTHFSTLKKMMTSIRLAQTDA